MANRDLQIGDMVTLSPNHNYRVTKTTPAEYNPIGIEGMVVPYTWGLQEGHWVQVEWDNGLTNHYPITDDYLININKLGNNMTNHTPEPWSIDNEIKAVNDLLHYQNSIKDAQIAGIHLNNRDLAEQLAAVTAQRDELLKDLQAIERLIDKPECNGLDRPTDFAISHDRGMRIASIQSAIKKSIAKCEVQNG